MTKPEQSPENAAANAPEVSTALAPLLERIAVLPPEEREYWMNNFIEQLDESQCVWSKGTTDWDSAANALKLQGRLERLLRDLPPEARSGQIEAFIEEYAFEEEHDRKYVENSLEPPRQVFDAPLLEDGEKTYTVCEGYKLFKQGLLPGLED